MVIPVFAADELFSFGFSPFKVFYEFSLNPFLEDFFCSEEFPDKRKDEKVKAYDGGNGKTGKGKDELSSLFPKNTGFPGLTFSL